MSGDGAVYRAPFPQLRSERLLLRELAPEDAGAIFRVFSNPEVTRYYDLDTFTDPSQAEALCASWRERYERRIGVRWAVCRRESPALIGTVGFNLWVQSSARAILGFDLDRRHWRQGIMTEALGLVLDFGFESMELNRVEALVFAGNEASAGLLEKVGFEREGTLREYEYLQGRHQDMWMYALLRRTWVAGSTPGSMRAASAGRSAEP